MTSIWLGPKNRSITNTIVSPNLGLSFPRIGLVANGGDQSYGCNATNSFTPWTTAGAGNTSNAAIQSIGAYDFALLNGAFEGWDSSGQRDRENLTQALLKNATYTVKLNKSRPTIPFYYCFMMAAAPTGSGYQQFVNIVQANNWWLYESTGGTGTITPAGGGSQFINYSTAWPTGIGNALIGQSITGTNYGTVSNGSPTGPQGTARTFGNYNALKLLIRNNSGIDPRFTFNPQMASPSAGGVFLDDCFLALDGSGSGVVHDSSLDGVTIAPGSQTGGGFPALDTPQPVMARGNHNFFDQLNTMVSTYSPSSQIYNIANFGQYANVYQFGTAALTQGLENTLQGGLLENVVGAGSASWEWFQNRGTDPSGWRSLREGYYQGLDFCVAPAWWNATSMGPFHPLVGIGVKLPGTDLSTASSFGVNGTLTTVNSGTALEYQVLRYALCTALLGDGLLYAGATGYSWSIARWYDEYGDDSLTQVNVPRGYLGYPLTVRPTAPTWSGGFFGIWSQQYTNGIAIVNPRGNGSQTVTTAMLPGTWHRLQGTQQPSINSGALFTGVTLGDGDGIILLRG